MNNLNKDFLEYQEAFELKKLGFDEPCNTCYDKLKMVASYGSTVFDYKNYNTSGYMVSRPTYSQAFRFFRENHSLHFSIEEYELILGQSTENYDPLEEQAVVYLARVEEAGYIKQLNTYEEAELGCLRAMIKLVKSKS